MIMAQPRTDAQVLHRNIAELQFGITLAKDCRRNVEGSAVKATACFELFVRELSGIDLSTMKRINLHE
jgi:hypothetical protein